MSIIITEEWFELFYHQWLKVEHMFRIEEEDQYNSAVTLLEYVTSKLEENPNYKTLQTLDNVLTLAIKEYGDKRFEIPDVPHHEVLKFLMEQQRLSKRDLLVALGFTTYADSEQIADEFLCGTRELNLHHIKSLCKSFNLSADVFIH